MIDPGSAWHNSQTTVYLDPKIIVYVATDNEIITLRYGPKRSCLRVDMSQMVLPGWLNHFDCPGAQRNIAAYMHSTNREKCRKNVIQS